MSHCSPAVRPASLRASTRHPCLNRRRHANGWLADNPCRQKKAQSVRFGAPLSVKAIPPQDRSGSSTLRSILKLRRRLISVPCRGGGYIGWSYCCSNGRSWPRWSAQYIRDLRPRTHMRDEAREASETNRRISQSEAKPSGAGLDRACRERAGAIRVVENINSIKLCLSLFAVRLETRDLST